MKIYRVVNEFITQWGIPKDPSEWRKWGENKIKDDPVKMSNTKGTLSFATSGPNCRGSQIFINVGNNPDLDGQGFAPFAHLVRDEDLQVFRRCHDCSQYVKLDQFEAKQTGNLYFEKLAPKLSWIKSARIVG